MIHFYKYQGTGNDFIMVDDRDEMFPAGQIDLIERICNRRFGIGADGLILLQNHKDGSFYMQYFNSDGRESSMCGNGGRCFAQFIFDLGLGEGEVKFTAIDGPHVAKKGKNSDIISLQMKDVAEIETLGQDSFELNTGSPHYVQFLAEPLLDIPLVEMAKKVRYNSPYSEKGINVNYLNLLALKKLKLRTYERGVEDETLSCGTGATAAALSLAVFNQLPAGKHKVEVSVMGGELEVLFHYFPETKRFENVWLCGPAKKVFEGEILL